MGYWLYQIGMLVNGLLPRTVAYWASRRVADAYYLFGRQARKAMLNNLRVALGPQASQRDLRRTARCSFRSFGAYLCEFFLPLHRGSSAMFSKVCILDRQHLDQALAEKKGCILVSGHYSNWELGAMVLGSAGYGITAITMEHEHPGVNRLFVEQRSGRGVTVKHSGQGGLAGLKALKDNRLLAINGDRTTGGPTVTATLFGRPIELPQGPWRLADSSGAPILPTFVHRLPDGRYELRVGKPLPRTENPRRESRMELMAQGFAQALEEQIREDPGQWEVFFPIWPADKAGIGEAELGKKSELDENITVSPALSGAAQSTRTEGRV